MANINKKVALIICLTLSLLIMFVLSSCYNGETPTGSDTNTDNSSINTDINSDSSTDKGNDDNAPDIPTDYIIEEADGFDFDTTGTTLKIYKTVSNTTDAIDLSSSITVTKGSTWKMYKDFLGEEEYRLKSMYLSVGENKAYIIVYHPNGEGFTRYELVIYRLDMKDYSFISDNVPYENGSLEELSSVEAPATTPQKVGYEFMGWTVDNEIVSFPYQVSVDTVFEAKFAPIEYGIEYNLNNGTNDIEYATKYTIEQSFTLFEPIRNFYSFDGWYESNNFDGNAITEIAVGSYGNKTFYAKWTPITYDISYVLNGGTNDVENPNTYNTEISVELKAPTKAGYTFAGWFADKDFSVEATKISLGEGNAKTFYAKWTANENTIVFNANGGKGTMSSITASTDSTVKLTANTFTKDGYSFKGWATTKDGSVAYADGASYTMGTEESYTLYAVWEANKNTLIFDANGGSGSMSNMTIANNSTAKLTSNAFTKAGYTFTGWATTANGGVEYTDGANYTMGTNNSYTLYAVWEANKNTLVFNANGGSGSMSNMTIATDSTAELTSNAFTKVGYTFIGWAITVDGGVAYVDGASYTIGTEESYTLYAVWEANKNTLVFDSNGGSGSMSNMTIATDNTAILTSNAFTKAGYTFMGWATTADGGVEYTDGTNYTMGTNNSYTLYAIWQVNINGVIFNANGGKGTMSSFELATGITSTLPKNTFTKDGYSFKGWATTKGGSVAYADVASYTMGTAESYTLYAVWEANKNTLVFDANGGSGSMSNMTIATDSTTELTSNAFTKIGYTFIGWATTKGGSVEYTDGASYAMGTKNSYTLFAVWKVITYDISYELNDGINHDKNKNTYNIEEFIELKAPFKSGYTFAGWFTDSNFNTLVEYIDIGSVGDKTFYAKWTPNENALIFNGNGSTDGEMPTVTVTTNSTIILPINTYIKEHAEFLGWATVPGGDVVYNDGASYTMGTDSINNLYAIWKTKKYTVKFDVNGGVGNIEDQIIEANKKATAPTAPTLEGYTFEGWYLDGEKWSFIGYLVTGDITLVAKWIPNNNSVIFNANGGSGSMDDLIIATNSEAKLTINTFTKPGYSFIGWATSPNGSVRYNDNDNYIMGTDESYTLYAVWQVNKNLLIFDANGGNGEMISLLIFANESISLPTNKFTRENCHFIGWSTSPYGEVIYTEGATYKIGTDHSYTLYAVWEKNSISISINSDGATDGHIDNISVVPGNYITIPKNTFIYDGYTYSDSGEWSLYCRTCNSNLYCGSTKLSSNGYLSEGNKVLIPSYHNYELVSQWRPLMYYSISFNPAGAIINEYKRHVAENEPIGTLPEPQRDGYVFDGWYDSNSTKISSTDYLTESISVVAKWRKNSHTPSETTNIADLSEITISSGLSWGYWMPEYITDGDITTGTYSPKGRIPAFKLSYDAEYYVTNAIIHLNGFGELSEDVLNEQIFDTDEVQVKCYNKNGECVFTSDKVTASNLTACEFEINQTVAVIEFLLTPSIQSSSAMCSVWEVEVFSANTIPNQSIEQENVAHEAIISSTVYNSSTQTNVASSWWAMDLTRIIDGDPNTGTHTVKSSAFSIWLNFGHERDFSSLVIHCNGKGALSPSTGINTSNYTDSNGEAYGDRIYYNSYMLTVVMYDKYNNVVYETGAIDVSNIDKLILNNVSNVTIVELKISNAGSAGHSGSIYLWDVEAYEAKNEHNCSTRELIEAVAPNCTYSGTAIYRCECGLVYEELLLPQKNCHVFLEGRVISEATEYTNGSIRYTCAICGKVETKEIPAISHNWGDEVIVNPTCTEKGYIAIYCEGCSVNNCNASIITTYIDELGHNYGNATRNLDPNDNSKVIVSMECLRDGCDSKKSNSMSVNYYEIEKEITRDNVISINSSHYSELAEYIFDGKLDGNFWCAPGSYTYNNGTMERNSGTLELIFDKEYIFTRCSLHVNSNYNWLEVHFMYQDNNGEWITSLTYVHDRISTSEVTELNLTQSLTNGVRASKIVIEVVSSRTSWMYSEYEGSGLQFHEIELTAHECVYELNDYIFEGRFYIPATCTADGQALATCSLCKETSLVTLKSEEFGHNYGETIIKTAPTSCTNGVGYYICQNEDCKHVSQDVIIPHSNTHSYSTVCIIKETESHSGIYAYYCENCKKIFSFYVVAPKNQ